MAKLHKFTSIKAEEDENGESNSFENPSYVCDFDDKEEPRHAVQFSPQKKRCTPFNFAVAIFILASGGLAVFLIVKFSQDNYDADPTSRPRLGGFTTKPPDTGVNFDVTLRLSNQIWTDDFLDTSSEAYRNLSNSLTEQIKEGLNATETGPNLSGVFITGIRNGSVIIDVLIQLKNPSLAPTLLSSLRNATERAKSSGLLPLLADVDTESIYISLTLQTTTTVIKDTTSVMTSSSSSITSSSPTQISSSSTTSSTTTPISSTTTSSSTNTPISSSIRSSSSSSSSSTSLLTSTPSSSSISTTMATETMTTPTTSPSKNVTTVVSSTPLMTTASSTPASFTPSTSLPPPMMTTTGIRIISPCNNTAYLTKTLTEQCLNTTQLSEVQHSTVDIKCNFVLTSIDCVLNHIQKEFNITCSESDKHAAAKEFSSLVSGYLGINPEICLIPSTSSPPLIPTTTAMKIISPCDNTAYLTKTLTEQCLNTTQLSEVQHATDDIKCNFVLTSIDCVLGQIQKEFSITCSESDKHAAAKEFSSLVSGYLGINPEICLIPSSSSPPLILTTTAMKIISPCDNTAYLTKTLTEQCLNTTQLSEVQHATDDIKCNFVLTSIDCVLNQIQKEFNITCSESDKHAAAKEFSSIVSGYLGINPEICLIPSTSSPPLILTTTAMKIISPCNNTAYLTQTLTEQCLNTTQLSEVQLSTVDIKCNFVLTSIDCVLNQIQNEFNITCSEADKHAAAKEFSSIVHGYLGINPEICLSTSPLTPTSTPTADVTTHGVSTEKPTLPPTTSSRMTTMLTSETMPHTSSRTTTSLPETSKTLTPTILSTTGKTTISTPKIMTSTTLSPTTSKTTKLTETTATSFSSPTTMETTMSSPTTTTTTTFSSPTMTTAEPLPTMTTVSKITTSSPVPSSLTTTMVSSTAKTTKITSLPPTWTSVLSPTTIGTVLTTVSSTNTS
ncbi:mucin-5AC-like isoform X1 [Saccostrea cucullata]|uniref:mucin-5AC-like isoform X1 n=1 Tax=Saccostrea cuccullata TaxID=36930 RepID=UPI002ED645E8